MCGIVAVAHEDTDTARELATRMLNSVRHRGSDPPRLAEVDGVVLGSVRLPIVGGKAGEQPLVAQQYAGVMNGEIYNFSSVDPAAVSDAAICLEQVWRGQVGLLNGMFAAAVVDRNSRRLVAVRDPLGVKPLYWWQDSTMCVFVSELKMLCEIPTFDGQFDHVPPGGCLTIAIDGRAPAPHPMEQRQPPSAGPDACLLPLADAIEHAVALRIPDEPFAVLVSGGVDSSMVAALAARHRPLLIAAAGPGSDDARRARELADWLDCPVDVAEFSEVDVQEVLPEVVRHLESPDKYMVANAIPTYFAMRQAAGRGVRVVLTGDGADELFLGYPYVYQHWRQDTLEQVRAYLIRRLCTTEMVRLDRMSMAHTVEAREPLLDRDVVAAALALPAPDLSRRDKQHLITKIPLRRAATRWLPRELAWRPKEHLFASSGTWQALEKFAAASRPAPIPPPVAEAWNLTTEVDRLCFELFARAHPALATASGPPIWNGVPLIAIGHRYDASTGQMVDHLAGSSAG